MLQHTYVNDLSIHSMAHTVDIMTFTSAQQRWTMSHEKSFDMTTKWNWDAMVSVNIQLPAIPQKSHIYFCIYLLTNLQMQWGYILNKWLLKFDTM